MFNLGNFLSAKDKISKILNESKFSSDKGVFQLIFYFQTI